MKNVLIVLLAFLAAWSGVSAQSMLKVRLADNRPINVSVDGRYFNKKGTAVTVGDLPYGRHFLKIYALSGTRRGRAFQEVVYQGRVETYEGMITLFYFDPYSGQVDSKEQYISNYTRDHQQPGVGEWHGETGGNAQEYSRQGHSGQDVSAEPQGPVASPVSHETNGTLDQKKLDKLKAKITVKKVDTEKMNLLKDALKNETFNTGQVGAMMDWFSFETSKVEFAEWAYGKTVDKEIFSDLLSVLSYQNYKDELQKFIAAQP